MAAGRVVVVGQGYVGLPLAMRACEVGYDVVGFDVDRAAVELLARGESYVGDISVDRLEAALAGGRYRPTADPALLADFDIAVITVPTPLRDGDPDLSYIEEAARLLGAHLRPGACVILESTTYPGTTDELVAPLLQAGSGLEPGVDFHLGYSPERINPGDPHATLEGTPKVVSGIDAASLERVQAFYDDIVERTVPVSGTREAELTKLLENTFRHVNVALVNELAMFASDLGIDVWEAIDAADTKPFGFMRFEPGPGVGGHCLPIDPSYLAWKVQDELGAPFRFVELANEVNDFMPEYVVRRLGAGLHERVGRWRALACSSWASRTSPRPATRVRPRRCASPSGWPDWAWRSGPPTRTSSTRCTGSIPTSSWCGSNRPPRSSPGSMPWWSSPRTPRSTWTWSSHTRPMSSTRDAGCRRPRTSSTCRRVDAAARAARSHVGYATCSISTGLVALRPVIGPTMERIMSGQEVRAGVDRRTLITRAAALGAAAWTAPVILDSLASPAGALTPAGCSLYVITWTPTGSGSCDSAPRTIVGSGTCADPTSTTCVNCPTGCTNGTVWTRATVAGTANPTITGCSQDTSGATGSITPGTATVASGCRIIGWNFFVTTCPGATTVALNPGSGSTTQSLGGPYAGKNTAVYLYLLVECS